MAKDSSKDKNWWRNVEAVAKDEKIRELEEKVKTLEIENKVLKEQILAMVHPVYTYGIR